MSNRIESYLDGRHRLSPGTFKVPLMLRLANIWRNMKFVFLGIPVLALVAGIFLPAATGTAFWALLGFIIVVLLMMAWGAYWFGFHNANLEYKVHGLNVKFTSEDYFVPQDLMRKFVGEILAQWNESGLFDFDAKDMLSGVRLTLTGERPVDPFERVPADSVIGISYTTGNRYSLVYGPYVLSHGGAGYELRLQMCGFLYPERTEREDIAWMQKNELI